MTETEKDRQKLGKRVRKWRKETLGLNTKGLSAELGVSQGSLSEIETGKSHPSYSTVKSIYKYMKRIKKDEDFLPLMFGG